MPLERKRAIAILPGAAALALLAFAGRTWGMDDPLGALSAAFEEAAAKAGPAVVQVLCDRTGDLPPGDNTRGRQEEGRGARGPQPNQVPDEVQTRYQESLMLFDRPEGPASGVLVESDGYVLTSLYNVAGAVSRVRVVLPDGRELPARILGRDPNKDLALLKIEATGLPFLSVSADSRAVPGQYAIALGRGSSPGELNLNAGIVSALIRYRGDAIQTSAKVNYGNSGGPLVDLSGNLLGVISRVGHDADRSRSAGINTGVGFAAPAAGIAQVLERLKRGESIPERPRPFLGIRFDPSFTGPKGARIEYAYRDYPGGKAGLKAGDVLLNFDHVDIETSGDLRFVIEQCDPGQKVTYSVMRGDKDLDLESVLTARPPDSESDKMTREYLEWKSPRALGVRPQYDYDGPGAFVQFVHEGFPIHAAGLAPGEFILSAYGLRELPGWFPISNLVYFDRALQYCWEGAAATFLVWGEEGARLVPIIMGRQAGDGEAARLDQIFDAERPSLPRVPAPAKLETMRVELARWQVLVLLGVSLGERTAFGWEAACVHRGFPGDVAGLKKGDVLTSLNEVPAADLPNRLQSLFTPNPNRLIWMQGDRWVVEAKRAGSSVKVTARLAESPEPALIRAMREEAGAGVHVRPSDAARLLAILGNWEIPGRTQALAALTREGMWKTDYLKVLVELLGERDRDFSARVADAIQAHPSAAAIRTLIQSFPTESPDGEAPAPEKAKVKILKAWLDSSAWPGKAPDIGPDGVRWKRWWNENGDKVRLK